MRVGEKTLYKIICTNREKRETDKLKTQINYIDVFLNSGSEIKLKNEKGLMNTVTEMYTVHMNAAYMTARCFSAEKYYWATETVWPLNRNQKSKALDTSAEDRSDNS